MTSQITLLNLLISSNFVQVNTDYILSNLRGGNLLCSVSMQGGTQVHHVAGHLLSPVQTFEVGPGISEVPPGCTPAVR